MHIMYRMNYTDFVVQASAAELEIFNKLVSNSMRVTDTVRGEGGEVYEVSPPISADSFNIRVLPTTAKFVPPAKKEEN